MISRQLTLIMHCHRELQKEDLVRLGYSVEMAVRIVELLKDQAILDYYLAKGRRFGCVPLTRTGENYPLRVRKSLGDDSPGCLWAKGDLSLLETPKVALVGSRELREENRVFAEEVGKQAALQGYTLVSGDARGADRTAQESCLYYGGRVISVVADQLAKHPVRENVLYLSEDGFDLAFSAQRALHRNRVIHCLGMCTFVAQCRLKKGGTWDGTEKNLQNCWSSVYCLRDDSPASKELEQMGVALITPEDLGDIAALQPSIINFIDQ